MSRKLIHRGLRIANLSTVHYTRKFLNFPSILCIKSSFCSRIKDKQELEDDKQCDDIDIDKLKNEMFEDFENEKDILQTNTLNMDTNLTENQNENTDIETQEITENNISEYNVFEEKDELSFTTQQFKRRMEFNQSLRKVAKVKAIKGVKYNSTTLSAGIPELIYDAEDVDKWVIYLRLYTYTPFVMGILFVPIAVFSFPDWEFFPKLLLGGFYMGTSAIFPAFGYRAVKHKVNKVWLTPDCEKLIVEKLDFFFQPYKNEYFIKDLRMLYQKGSERTCWFQCTKTKAVFLMISEMMQHSVWLQIIGVDQDQVADATLRNIANDGVVNMFRGKNTG